MACEPWCDDRCCWGYRDWFRSNVRPEEWPHWAKLELREHHFKHFGWRPGLFVGGAALTENCTNGTSISFASNRTAPDFRATPTQSGASGEGNESGAGAKH